VPLPTSSASLAPIADPARVLQEVFGYGAFRGPQAEIVAHVVEGGSALVLRPTGGGKSLCCQIPALCRAGLGVVVSPLIALMQDQVEGLRQAGVRAAALHSSLEPGEAAGIWRALEQGDLDLLYVSPERLLSPGFLDRLAALPLALFAIDEAHGVSQWGHDFRPDYLQLAVLAERFSAIPRLALTATADPRTREEIRERLQLQQDRVFLASFDRPNIRDLLRDKDDARSQLLAFLAERRAWGSMAPKRGLRPTGRLIEDAERPKRCCQEPGNLHNRPHDRRTGSQRSAVPQGPAHPDPGREKHHANPAERRPFLASTGRNDWLLHQPAALRRCWWQCWTSSSQPVRTPTGGAPIDNSLCLRSKQEAGRCQGSSSNGVRRVLSRPLNAYQKQWRGPRSSFGQLISMARTERSQPGRGRIRWD